MSIPSVEKNIVQHLENAYLDAKRKGGLIDFTHQVRGDENDLQGKYSIQQKDLTTLFSDNVWVECKKKGGHRKIQNIVTGIRVEYANHDNSGGIDPGAVTTILKSVQAHLNILGNDIFAYKKGNFKSEPDYSASSKRWVQIQKDFQESKNKKAF